MAGQRTARSAFAGLQSLAMPASQHPERLGKYEILSVVGRGGMGVVYKARDPVIDRLVAIKTINEHADGVDDDFVRRLLVEARSAGRLHHPNIVTVFDYGEVDDICYIVLEYAEGIDLGRVIAAREPMALPARVDILLQVCSGLGYAHECGVTHRDMKPSNVCLLSDGVAKILDFGLARYDDTHLTKTGHLSGTVPYMSPERLNGQAGKSDDLFALGAVAYEVLTYQRAFPGTAAPEVMFKILTMTPPAPSTVAEVPPEIDAVILKCLEREPENRYESPYDFGEALNEAFSSDAAQRFVLSEQRSPEFRETLARWSAPRRRDLRSRSERARSGTLGARHTVASEAALPTQITANTDAQLGATQGVESPVTIAQPVPALLATSPEVVPAGAPTEIVSRPAPPSRRGLVYGAAAGVLLLVLSAVAINRFQPSPAGPPERQTSAGTASAPPATATGLEELSSQVKPALDTRSQTEISVQAPVTATVTTTRAPHPVDTSQPATPQRRSPVSTVQQRQPSTRQPETLADPVPQSVTPQSVAPVPVTAAQPPPSQPAVRAAAPDPAEVSAFMRRVADAYQSRDAGFFRDHHLRYTDAMGNAIRNSPSVRVTMIVQKIDFAGADSATVTVQRKDEFQGGAQPASRGLVYHLERRNGGWRIARFELAQ